MKNNFKKVFLSYINQDRDIAYRIIDELQKNDMVVYHGDYNFDIGESISDVIESNISVSDYIIILLSSNFSKWQEYEMLKGLEENFSKRDITILPVILDKTKLPEFLNSYQYIDLSKNFREGVDILINQLQNTSIIDFSKISGYKFENLVSDLLEELGFLNLKRNIILEDSEIDIIGQFPYTDPFGNKKLETWVVEAKLYKKSRLDIKAIQKIRSQLLSYPDFSKALLVTNGHLTSATKKFLDFINRQEKLYIRVIEGTELKRLLLKNNDILSEYFI